jgi:hypothetical protein
MDPAEAPATWSMTCCPFLSDVSLPGLSYGRRERPGRVARGFGATLTEAGICQLTAGSADLGLDELGQLEGRPMAGS